MRQHDVSCSLHVEREEIRVGAWVDDFKEMEATKEEVIAMSQIVRRLSDTGAKPVLMMFGGYFSMLLWHFGLSGICHGTLFSQSRGVWDSVRKGSGPAPIRYYIPSLHEFFTLENAVELAREDDSLLCSCLVCRRVVRGKPDNISAFENEEALAEMHFFRSRLREKKEVGQSTVAQLAGSLEEVYAEYKDSVGRVTRTYRTPWGTEERPIARLDYLDAWAKGLREAARD